MYEKLINFIRDWYQTDQHIPLHEPRFDDKDREFVLDAVESTFVSSIGEYVDRFESKLARCLGVKRAVVTVNGTAALDVALRLVGVRLNDEVITQPLTFAATANAIAYNNAIPVFVDVCPETLGMSPDSLNEFLRQNVIKKEGKAFNKKTKNRVAAIVPMHTFGHPCKIEEIREIADEWDIEVVEDAAEALGSTYKGKSCGTFGKMGIFSFNGNKIITCGGGGAIVTDDCKLADKAKHLTTTAKLPHAWEFIHDEVGFNYRMPNLNAALACSQLEKLEIYLTDKRALSKAYQSFFNTISECRFISEPENCRSNFWLNAILAEDRGSRDKILEKTNNSGIMTRPAWRLMSDLKMYKQCQKTDLKNARWLQDRIVNIPSSVRQYAR